MMRINNRDDLHEYLNHEKIECLECGKRYAFLPPHLSRAHQMTSKEYREKHNIPATAPLAGTEYRKAHSEKIKRQIEKGILDYSHLSKVVLNNKNSGRGVKRNYDIERQREIAKNIKRKQLPPKAKRKYGRDADRAREYQRKYRARKKELGRSESSH